MSSLHDDPSETPLKPQAPRTLLGRCFLALAWGFIFLVSAFHRIAFWLDEWIFPEIHKVEVRKPLFVLGVPRSGTTHFHRLVASQREVFTTPPLWELVVAPALCQKYVVWGIYRLDQLLSFGLDKGPMQRLVELVLIIVARVSDEVHPTDLNAPEEDTLGLIPFDGCFLRVMLWPLHNSTWELGYFESLPEDRRKALLNAYKGLVVRHLYFRGRNLRLLSKNPGFTTWMSALSEVFEDACFVGLRRPPEASVPSQLSSLRAGLKMFGHSPTDPRIVQRFVGLLSQYWSLLDEAVLVRSESQFQLIEYQLLMSAPKQAVLETLRRFGYSVSLHDEQSLDRLTERASGYRSRHTYRLAEFGLTAEYLNQQFFHHRAPKPHEPSLDATYIGSSTPS